MQQINCYIPIKVRVTGRLSDAQLAELSATVERMLSARMAVAQRTLLAHGVQARGTESMQPPVELFEPARWTPRADTYTVPSYKDGGTPTPVKIQKKRKKRPQFELTD